MNENEKTYVDINAHDNYPDSEQKIEIPTMKVIPLKKICMTIGQLPSAYLETMSYYEMLIWFIEYLKNNIIPTINNNASAVQEVQSVVLSLQNYINDYKDSIDSDVEDLEEYMNTYFQNLDVQDEINNKLDQMLEDGVLTEIIQQFLQSTAIWCFDNVADMKQANNLINGSFAKTLGYYEINDGGEATYKITNTASETEYQEELESGLFATLIIPEVVTPEMFGAKGDGLTDDTTALNETFKHQKIQMRKNAVYFVKYVDLIVPSTIVEGNNATISINTDIDDGQLSNGFGNFIYRNTYTYDTFILKNLNFNGNFDTFEDYQNYDGYQINFMLVSANKYKYAKIENCNFTNCIQDALWIINTNRVEIIGNTFKNIATAQYPSMIGTLNAITAMSNRVETSTLLIKNNTFETIHDSVCRIDDFGSAEFSNNVCKDIRFCTCETFWNNRDYKCNLNVYGNTIEDTAYFVTCLADDTELKNIDVNIYNNNVKGLGFNEIGTSSSSGKFLSCAYGTVEANANVYNNIIEADYADGCLFYSSGNYINIHDNRINVKAIVNNATYGNGIVNGREVHFKNNYLKYDISKLYNLFYLTSNQSETNDVKAYIENNKIFINYCSRLIELSKNTKYIKFNDNEVYLNGENTEINTICQGVDNTTEISHIQILNNLIPSNYTLENLDITKVDLILKNNIFKSSSNLSYKINSIDSTKKVVNDNLLIL